MVNGYGSSTGSADGIGWIEGSVETSRAAVMFRFIFQGVGSGTCVVLMGLIRSGVVLLGWVRS